ncbi:EamA family transporter [Thermincola ferriacetica]
MSGEDKQGYYLILLSLFLMVFGQIMSKMGSSYESLFNVFVVVGYAALLLRGLVWLFILKRLPVSFAYPMMSLSFVLILVASYFVFGEAITLYKLLGSLLIIAGVFFISSGGLKGEGS